MNRLYLGEACNILVNDILSNTIDLTITSPPYDDVRLYNGYTFNYLQMIDQLYRVTKEGGIVVWVVGDQVTNGSESGTSFKQALAFIQRGFKLHDTMIYQKNSMTFPSKTRYHACFEYMFVFSKGAPKTVHLLADRKNRQYGNRITGTSRNTDGSMFKRSGTRLKKDITEYGIRFNIWKYETGKHKSTKDSIAYNHPATFPELLARDHILSWSNEDDIIFDPMCGSGTVLKQAALLNRQFIGIDISETYMYTIVIPRLEAHAIEYEIVK